MINFENSNSKKKKKINKENKSKESGETLHELFSEIDYKQFDVKPNLDFIISGIKLQDKEVDE